MSVWNTTEESTDRSRLAGNSTDAHDIHPPIYSLSLLADRLLHPTLPTTSLGGQALNKKLSAVEQEAGDLKEGLGRRDAEVAALKAEIARTAADTQAAAEKAEQELNAVREEVAGLEAR